MAAVLYYAGYESGGCDGDVSLDGLAAHGFLLTPRKADLVDDALCLCRNHGIPLAADEAEPLFRAGYEAGFREWVTPERLGAAVRTHVASRLQLARPP